MAHPSQNPRRPLVIVLASLLLLAGLPVDVQRADAQRGRRARVSAKTTKSTRAESTRNPVVTSRTFKDSRGERNIKVESWRNKNILRSFRRSPLRVLVRLATGDSALGASMYATRNNERLIESTKPGVKRFGYTRRARRTWVQLATRNDLRRWTVRTLNRDFKRRTRELEQLFDKSKKPVAYDDVIVGAGPNGVTIANQILENDPSRRVLVIDASDTIASTFAEIGAGIKINSSSRAQDGVEAQMFGMGNNNPLPGSPVGVPDIDGNVKWPEAAALADAVTFSAAASGADFLMESSAVDFADVRAQRGPGTARVKVKGTDGKTREVFANNVVVTSGLGRPTLRLKDRRATNAFQKYVARERQKLDRGETPSVMYYKDALRMVKESFIADPSGGDPLYDFRVPYRRAADGQLKADARRKPKIAVIGSGDSGKTLMNLYFGTGPDAALNSPGRLGQSQLGQLGDLDWVVGSAFRTCVGYINSTRARYAQTSAEVKSGRVIPFEARVLNVSKRGEKSSISYRFEVGKRTAKDGKEIPVGFTEVVVSTKKNAQGVRKVADVRSAETSRAKTTYLVPTELLGRGLKLPKNARIEDGKLVFEKSKTYDRVIIATGFENQAAPLLRDVTGKADAAVDDADTFELIKGDVPGLGKGRAIARQVVGSPQFKIAGPSAGPDLIGIGSISGIEENRVGLKVWSPRNAVLGAQIAATPRIEGGFDSFALEGRTRQRLKSSGKQKSRSYSFERPDGLFTRADARLAYETGIGEALHFRHELGMALDGFNPGSLRRKSPIAIQITRRATFGSASDAKSDRGEPKVSYSIRIPDVDNASARAIAKRLEESETFVGLLEGKIGYRGPAGNRLTAREVTRGKTRVKAIEFQVPLTGNRKAFDVGEISLRSIDP